MGKINQSMQRPEDTADDLAKKAARYGAWGWIAFFITLTILVLQNIVIAMLPKPVAAVEAGKIVGTVVYDEAVGRDVNIISGDIKDWVKACISLNKHNIYNDLDVCLTHMSERLGEKTFSEYERIGYAPAIEINGCSRQQFQFDIDNERIIKDKENNQVYAELYGVMLCFVSGKVEPIPREFKQTVLFRLMKKTEINTLGIEVIEYDEIVEDILNAS